MEQKLKNKKNIQQSWQLIKKSHKITLLTHFRPDGDGIAACAAFDQILKKLNKKIETIYPNKSLFDFKIKPTKPLICKHTQIPDLIIALDTANYERLYFPDCFKNIPIINIDHHISNTISGKYNFIEAKSSSTCEVLYELIKNWDQTLFDKKIAQALLFGILYDSQVYHTQSTYPKTLRISADLMEYGADLYKLKTELLSNKNPEIIALWGEVMSKIQVTQKGKAVWTSITQKDLKKHNIKQPPLIGFNNFLSQIAGIDVTILFQELETGQTKVSLRSKKTDVNKLASLFGGGGHKNAAGILSDKPISTLIKEITKLL